MEQNSGSSLYSTTLDIGQLHKEGSLLCSMDFYCGALAFIKSMRKKALIGVQIRDSWNYYTTR